MDIFYEETRLIDTRDIDPLGHCRPSAVLGILQDVATDASAQIQLSRETLMTDYGVIWMLARVWYRLDRPLVWNESLTVKTWHRGGKGAAMYRDFDLTVGGKPVGEAVSTWVLADWTTRKLVRLSAVAACQGSSGGTLCKDRLLPKLRLPEPMTTAERRRMHYSDADINGHVNNSKYADFVCDALHMEKLETGRFISALQVGFLAECLPGEELELMVGTREGTEYVRGADGQGRARFEAALTLS